MKIFIIGLAKTGTTSLGEALKILGYKVCFTHNKIDESLRAFKDNKISSPLELIDEDYDVYICRDISTSFILLAEFYPNSKFILTTRHIETWLNSKVIHLLWNRLSGQDTPWVEMDMSVEKRKWYKHHREIREYFINKQERLLTMRVCDGEGYPKLCKFLEKEVPEGKAFPRRNTSYKRLHEIYEYFV